jgi:hypothetical protein
MKRCMVYHACCQRRYFKMAAQSARSAKRHMPDVDTVLLTDLAGESKWLDVIIRHDPVKMIDAHLPPLWLLPKYDSGFYTGCNSYICAPMYDVFELVEGDKVDIASVHTSGKRRDFVYPARGVPAAYPYMRSSLLAFQDHERTRDFFKLWGKIFHEHKKEYRKRMAHEGSCFPDQGSMRIALYRSGLNVAIISPNYCTTCGDVVIRGKVRMIAGEGNMMKLAKEANKDAPYVRLLQRGRSTKLEDKLF